MSMAQSDQAGLDPDEGERLAFIQRKVDAEVCGRCRNRRQRLRIRLRPERPQFPQENVGGDWANSVKGEQTAFEIVRVARRFVHLSNTAVILIDKRLAVPQYLV